MFAFDIQLEIIKRLPVKSLIRFRSVCKAWKSLIDSSRFITGYSVPHTQPQHHLLMKYEVVDGQKPPEVKFVRFVDDDDTFPQQKFAPTVPPILQSLGRSRIIDSSCGLLCLSGFFQEPDNNSKTDMVVLWNPTIRKSIAVVVPNVERPLFNFVIGFGVCPCTKDPKLVKINYIHDTTEIESISCIPFQVMVFRLSSGEWTCLSNNHHLPRKSIEFTCSSTVIGQFIYWPAYDGGSRKLIMSFDMSSQEFREIDLPDCLADGYMSLSRLRESLVLLAYNINFTTERQVCHVWMMMEHGDSKAFTKLFTINPLPNASVLETLGFRKSGEPIVEMGDYNRDVVTPYALVVYEPCSDHIRDLGIHGNKFSFSVSSYTESMLLLNHDDGRIVK